MEQTQTADMNGEVTEVQWRDKVLETYKRWKYNDMHKDIKTYFNDMQHKKFGESFKREASPLIVNLSELKDDVTARKTEDKRVFIKQEDKTVNFLGEQIDVGEEEEDEVENFCKETLFGGFWKTITKLCNTVYLAVKSVGDVLKKLLKKLLDFLEAGMQKVVTALGTAVARIVAWAHPLPEYVVHEATGVLSVAEAAFANYGETVANIPGVTFFPKTVEEVQRVVGWARAAGLRVRCAGMKHSWSDVYSNTGEVLVMLLPLQGGCIQRWGYTGEDRGQFSVYSGPHL